MAVKIKAIPPNSIILDTYYSESGARLYRKIYLRVNHGQYGTKRVDPNKVFIVQTAEHNWQVIEIK